MISLEERVNSLRIDLYSLWPHPFEWMGYLKKPRFYSSRTYKNNHKKVKSVFANHGFVLNNSVALRYLHADAQRDDEDCGGAINRRLQSALDGQG